MVQEFIVAEVSLSDVGGRFGDSAPDDDEQYTSQQQGKAGTCQTLTCRFQFLGGNSEPPQAQQSCQYQDEYDA